jgi:predicted nucleotide-binding protein
MYTLLVTQLAAEQASGSFSLERERYLEFTSERISLPLSGLSQEAIECLCAWPCILMEEGRAEEVVRLVRISEVSATDGKIRITVEPVADGPGLTNYALFKLRAELDIGEFEFSRNHWAVKDRDLLEVLDKAGSRIGSAVRRLYEARPLPIVPPRAELIAVRDAMAALSHGGIDDLLLEAGVTGIAAGRDLGGRKARADAIVKFAVDHPFAVTAENRLFSRFLVSRVLPTATVAEVKSAALNGNGTPPAKKSEGRSPNRVFVVHGRNEPARVAVVAFLESVGLIGIVLHDQPNMGRHLLTKFIGEAELVTFAVVLMTDDDMGSAKGGQLAPRARQNVILELGYFLAHLGQPRVCALISPGLETPSDFDGIVYIRMGADERWQKELLRELKAAGMPVVEGAS